MGSRTGLCGELVTTAFDLVMMSRLMAEEKRAVLIVGLSAVAEVCLWALHKGRLHQVWRPPGTKVGLRRRVKRRTLLHAALRPVLPQPVSGRAPG